jgi:hypothetical protein
MKEKFEEIYNNTIPHSSFLSKRAIDSCMYQSYMLGKHEDEERYTKLRKAFLALLKELSNHQKEYNTDINLLEEDWKKQGGLI